ncbi:hypothetical protein SEVIR_8G243100v4 [Setaria viridis]|uniref:Retrovirus-related Pol polyprotein from transposon TNT 1-94-like beta-barrel domain-containing protein n=1 Tax=Setaria viridis TaxID=4556 RepID=A0A4U6TN49_SETVI|nr:uncharacterized protein LOC117866889 [Setaria viridis]XP_034607075.1 uncharacterized protein LOC117866889 [Setaria viridis]TKW02423.1 hypothetical protein SEVIR_8G243100v2 [Setaria viridis]
MKHPLVDVHGVLLTQNASRFQEASSSRHRGRDHWPLIHSTGHQCRALAATMQINASTSNLMATSTPYYPKDAFSINSGASHHLTGNVQLFDQGSLVNFNDTLKVGNAYDMNIVARGSISHRRNLTLPDVRYVPGLGVNVVSVALLDAMDYDVLFSMHGCLVKERLGGEVVGKATLLDGLYMVDYLRIPLDRSCLPDYETVEAALRLW